MPKQPWYQKEIQFTSVSQADVVTMAQNMAVMLKAGLNNWSVIWIFVETFREPCYIQR